MKNLSLSLALGAAVMVGGQAVQAAPVAPSQANIQSSWLFDETVGTLGTPSYGTPDSQGVGPNLQASRTTTPPENTLEVPLVGAGDSVAVYGGGVTTNFSPTPFNYAGNQSVLSDYYNATSEPNYPADRRTIGARTSTPSYSIGAEGAISFWYNPIYHPPVVNGNPQPLGPDESYLFALRNNVSGERLVAGIYTNANGDPTNGFITDASGNGGLQVADWGIDYSGLDNGSPSNTWYNVLVTWGADGLLAYVDGNLVAADAAFNLGAFDADRIYLGSYSSANAHAPGLYDELTIWNTQLTADNAQFLAQNSITALQAGTPVVPEPATAALGLMGLAGLAAASRRRRNA